MSFIVFSRRLISLPVSGDEVLQLQQPVFTVLHHLLSVQMLHQTRQDPARSEPVLHSYCWSGWLYVLRSGAEFLHFLGDGGFVLAGLTWGLRCGCVCRLSGWRTRRPRSAPCRSDSRLLGLLPAPGPWAEHSEKSNIRRRTSANRHNQRLKLLHPGQKQRQCQSYGGSFKSRNQEQRRCWLYL